MSNYNSSMVRLLFSFFVQMSSGQVLGGRLRASGRPLLGVWEVFWRPLAGLLEAFGGVRPHWRHLGRFVAQEDVKDSQRRSQDLSKTAPKGPEDF